MELIKPKHKFNPEYDKQIKDWCIQFGIKILNPCGFRGKKSKVYSNYYSERAFRKGIQKSYISVNTQKGLEFLKEDNKDSFNYSYSNDSFN